MAFNKLNQQQPTKAPAKLIRKGALSVSIWKREHEGKTYYDATPSRAYTPDDGKTWEYVNTFSTDDLATLANLLLMSQAWIINQPTT